MDSCEVEAEIHHGGNEFRSVNPNEIALEHGRTESVCQPPPLDDDDDGVVGISAPDDVVFGEDKEFLRL